MEVAVPLYPGFTALDAVGPYEVLARVPGVRVRFLAAEAGPVEADSGMLTLVAEARLDDVPAPEIVLVPGGEGTEAAVEDGRVVAWIGAAHRTSDWTCSVCTGSLLLGAAGLLEGVDATTHWLWHERLAGYGARPTLERVVERGRIVTAAGVSSGIDMALVLAARLTNEDVGQALQLGLEYDPQPPWDAGSPASAPEHVVELVRAVAGART